MGAAGIAWYQRRGTPARVEDPIVVKTVPVVKTDLVVTDSLDGTLGYGGAQPVKGARDGIVTWLPRPGASIGRGDQVYRADDRPVPLFYGAMPLYRDLRASGTAGRDVRIVADNLRALGYSIGRQPRAGETVLVTTKAGTERILVRKNEGVLTPSLIAALKRWQEDRGLPVTGGIGVGDVLVLSGPVRVQTVTALKGDSAAGPLMTVTSTAKVVTASATVQEAGEMKTGDKVTVRLPGDKSVPGVVSAIGTEVKPADEDAAPSEPKRTVTIALSGGHGLDGIEQAQVQVDRAGETRKGVLAVPVGALVALSEGGYAVQVAGNRLVAVETGLFAKGLVEVTGDGIAEGVPVVTTS
jgi:peptidoglycan hydrolase-like protein with peptidoglycan-binding domain